MIVKLPVAWVRLWSSTPWGWRGWADCQGHLEELEVALGSLAYSQLLITYIKFGT
jgi:hypothetical protein